MVRKGELSEALLQFAEGEEGAERFELDQVCSLEAVGFVADGDRVTLFHSADDIVDIPNEVVGEFVDIVHLVLGEGLHQGGLVCRAIPIGFDDFTEEVGVGIGSIVRFGGHALVFVRRISQGSHERSLRERHEGYVTRVRPWRRVGSVTRVGTWRRVGSQGSHRGLVE
jgi:hypothetical protein